MHETSPGIVEKHKLSIRRDNKSELNGANSKTIVDMELESMKNQIINNEDEDELEQRIYDDPCDLMDDVPIFRMTKSHSWFCCPSSEAFCVPTSSNLAGSAGQTNNVFYNRCPDYSLVTEAPRTQFDSVCCSMKGREK